MKARIGLELHVPLPTETKLFCRCSTNLDNKSPNTNVCPICVGLPGSKPSLNKAALTYGIKIAKTLNCHINRRTHFSRKTYFYPDLPKNFQITQYEKPISENGNLELPVDQKRIRIKRVHLEEDPGRITYLKDGRILIDYNRSGIPLAEIVTEPDFQSIKEVVSFMDLILAYLRYVDIRNPESLVRCDTNVSLEGGERVEIKNISGTNNIRRALEYEITKQRKLKQVDMPVEMITLMYDSQRSITVPLREKEYEEDYGYIFEPDLPLFDISPLIDNVEAPIPPDTLLKEFKETYDIRDTDVGKVKKMIFMSVKWAEILEILSSEIGYSSRLVNILTHLMSIFDENVISTIIFKHSDTFKTFIKDAIEKGAQYQLLERAIEHLMEHGELPDILKTEDDIIEIEIIVETYLRNNHEILENIKNNPKSINFVIGQIIRKTGLKHHAKLIYEIVSKHIEKTQNP